MFFKNIISISAVHIIPSELIKYDFKNYFKVDNFEIWDLGDYFFKNKKKYLNQKEINLKYYRKIISLDSIKDSLNQLGENDLLIDPFKVSYNYSLSKIIKKNKINILFFHLAPIPIGYQKFNFFLIIFKIFYSPKYYIAKLIRSIIPKPSPNYLLIVNTNNIKKSDFKISKKTKIILAHSFDYCRFLEHNKKSQSFKNKKNNFAVFLDEGVTGHPDYEYLNIKKFCESDIYYKEITSFFNFIENEFKLRVIIAGHPKIKYSSKDNYFKREIIQDETISLVKNANLVFSHMSTSINFAIIYKKPIIFLDSNYYINRFRNQIKLNARFLNAYIANLSNDDYKNNFSNKIKINLKAYEKYKKEFITYNSRDTRHSWKILNDNISYTFNCLNEK